MVKRQCEMCQESPATFLCWIHGNESLVCNNCFPSGKMYYPMARRLSDEITLSYNNPQI